MSTKKGDTDERRKRIQEVKDHLKASSNVILQQWEADDLSLDIQEAFWERVVAFEKATPVSLIDLLHENGMSVAAPVELNDAELSRILSELFETLAILRVFIENTNHLSDRQLYEVLLNILQEPRYIPQDNDSACHLDLLGGCCEEDNHIYLKYYADEAYRQWWKREWPNDLLPEKETPPFDRDRYLPKPY